jgi:hypothetical protein
MKSHSGRIMEQLTKAKQSFVPNTVEPGCKDIGLYDTSLIVSDILWYQLIRHR